MAEHINGILKDEFYLDKAFTKVAHAKRVIKNRVNLHNEIRLHLSLDYKKTDSIEY